MQSLQATKPATGALYILTMIRTSYFTGYFFAFVILCMLARFNSVGQVALGSPTIYLKSGAIKAPANTVAWLDSFSAHNDGTPVQVLVSFSKLPSPADKETLRQNGVTLLDYLPENTYTAVIQPNVLREVVMSFPLLGITNTRAEWKSNDFIWDGLTGQKGNTEILVSFARYLTRLEIADFVGKMGGTINSGPLEKYGFYKVSIGAARVRSLAQWYGVTYISPVTDIAPLDQESIPVVKGNVAMTSPLYGGYGLLGDSVTVGIGDNCSGIYHADIKDRIRNFNPAPKSSHGSHVNGIVGGSGNVDPFAIGMAPRSSLIDFLYDMILPATGPMYQDYNMTITNNSYTISEANCTYCGTYDAYSNFVDTLTVQYPDVVHVFASGNDGGMSCAPFLQGFATIGGGYQPAKNNIVVGSILDGFLQAPDESRGPMKDGRLKPEIVAVGVVAYAPIADDEYMWAAGTSMASPQVAGGLAQLTQRYKQQNGGAQPKADVLKTILLNGAMDLGNPGPDFSYGFGVMNVYRSLQIMDNNHYATGNIANGDSQSTTIVVPANTGQLKVMLCWPDVPANPVSSKALVNDLDLLVSDPLGGKHLPLILDPAPNNVNNLAVEGADHLNNVEQVTINNPAAGTYTIKTKGYSVPKGPQRFIIAYDFVPKALHLTYPMGGEQLGNYTTPFDTIRVCWDAVTDGNTFKVELSTDNGANWSVLSASVPAGERHFGFIGGGINSGKCMIRLSRNGTSEVATSGSFSISTQPVAKLDTAQCPGYVNIHWSPVTNATSYYMLCKKGFYMQVVDSVADTAYSFKNMSLTEKSYVSVQPVIDGKPAFRSLALITTANTGNCTKPVSNGDLMTEKLISANGGRALTKSAFTASSLVKVRLRNLYNSACSNYKVSYKVNAGAWQSIAGPSNIPAAGFADINLIGVPIAPTGAHNIIVAVTNLALTDPNKANDTIAFTITSLPNDPINLSTPFVDGFETMGVVTAMHDSMGVSPDGHWDFSTIAPTGRVRTYVNNQLNITGNRSIHLDASQVTSTGTLNSFTGTFNLSGYDTATTEIRVDFDYVLHGIPPSAIGNSVSVRAYDTLLWNPVYSYDRTAYPGTLTRVRSLSLTDAVRFTGRNFSTACQMAFVQNDTSLIADMAYGNGMTIDNFRMYTVANDVSVESILSPIPTNCGVTTPQPVIVKVRNGVNYTLHNVQMYYSLDGGPTQTGTIDSILPKTSIDYSFLQKITLAGGTTHSLNVWLSVAGDTYNTNDSILNYHIRNSAIVTTFPYLENFEQGDGGYFAEGYKPTWQFGTPTSAQINKAASGTKAWKTNLAGKYGNLELSYLYSPCFDISSLSEPMLSFSVALDIEDCGSVLCDAAYVECSFDGSTWIKLGSTGQGTNWYDPKFNIWNQAGNTRWHVASIPLPQPGGGASIRFRFVLNTDPGVTREGFAIDDIHIFDRKYPVFSGTYNTTSVTDNVGSATMDFLTNNSLIANIIPVNPLANGSIFNLYRHDTITNKEKSQYLFPVSYVHTIPLTSNGVNTLPAIDTLGYRLYITDKDVVRVVNDSTCGSCTKVADAYSLGVTQYRNANFALHNGKIEDDTAGGFTYIPYKNVKWVPYDEGYYAEFKTKPFTEFWLNNGGPTGTFSAGQGYLDFIAYRNGTNVRTSWYSLIDTAVDTYTAQWSPDSVHFGEFLTTPARHESVASYSADDPVNWAKFPTLFYRLQWTMTGREGLFYSPIRRVDDNDSAITQITFDAQMVNHSTVQLSWLSMLDGFADHYLIERARGDGSYSAIGSVRAVHEYGHQYIRMDQPTGAIRQGTQLHYRLTAVMNDGTTVVLPIRTVEWIDGNSIDNIYPNPTHDGTFTLEWHADAGSVMQLTMVDAVGKTIYRTTETSAGWLNKSTFQTINAPRGVYFLRLEIENRKYNIKLVME